MRFFADVFYKTLTSMFLTMFEKYQSYIRDISVISVMINWHVLMSKPIKKKIYIYIGINAQNLTKVALLHRPVQVHHHACSFPKKIDPQDDHFFIFFCTTFTFIPGWNKNNYQKLLEVASMGSDLIPKLVMLQK